MASSRPPYRPHVHRGSHSRSNKVKKKLLEVFDFFTHRERLSSERGRGVMETYATGSIKTKVDLLAKIWGAMMKSPRKSWNSLKGDTLYLEKKRSNPESMRGFWVEDIQNRMDATTNSLIPSNSQPFASFEEYWKCVGESIHKLHNLYHLKREWEILLDLCKGDRMFSGQSVYNWFKPTMDAFNSWKGAFPMAIPLGDHMNASRFSGYAGYYLDHSGRDLMRSLEEFSKGKKDVKEIYTTLQRALEPLQNALEMTKKVYKTTNKGMEELEKGFDKMEKGLEYAENVQDIVKKAEGPTEGSDDVLRKWESYLANSGNERSEREGAGVPRGVPRRRDRQSRMANATSSSRANVGRASARAAASSNRPVARARARASSNRQASGPSGNLGTSASARPRARAIARPSNIELPRRPRATGSGGRASARSNASARASASTSRSSGNRRSHSNRQGSGGGGPSRAQANRRRSLHEMTDGGQGILEGEEELPRHRSQRRRNESDDSPTDLGLGVPETYPSWITKICP